ncbi:MAG: anthranilate phosphoribosyltransferase [bacterium]
MMTIKHLMQKVFAGGADVSAFTEISGQYYPDDPLIPHIYKLLNKTDLSGAEAEDVMKILMEGKSSDLYVAALLAAMERKGYTEAEIAACASTMRRYARKIENLRIGDADAITDTCGTGGDRTGTINISTIIMFILAAAGIPVAKHGNRAATSHCGSADVLEELGVRIELEPAAVGECLNQIGLAFLFARTFHPAMKNVAGVRKELAELGMSTIFNFLGPLTNPANAKRQLLGIYKYDMVETITDALKLLGLKRAMVVHGLPAGAVNGLDEISTLGATKIVELNEDGKIKSYEVRPQDFGIKHAAIEDLRGGEKKYNAEILKNVLSGMEKGARRDVVLLNAAAGLVVGGKADSIPDGLGTAEKILNDGSALNKLEQLIELTNKLQS